MFDILKSLIFPSNTSMEDDEFWIKNLKTNLIRAKIVIVATVIIEIIVAISLLTYHIKEPFTKESKYYMLLYALFILLSLIFYFIITRVQKNLKISYKSTLVTYGYIAFIIIWNLALVYLDGDISTYIISIMAIGLIGTFKPVRVAAIIFFSQLSLFIIVPFCIKDTMLFSVYINSSVAAIVAFVAGIILFDNILINFAVHKEINIKSQELEKVNDELKKANTKLKYLSQTDGLTGIYNRRMFDNLSIEFWDDSIKEGKSLAVIMIDIDHFKIYNDTYGHQKGDECLKILVSEMKRMIPNDYMLARYGGEEFAVLVKGIVKQQAIKVAEGIRTGVEALCLEHKNSPVKNNVTLSFGVYCDNPSVDSSIAYYIRCADKALFHAKDSGRNIVIAG